MREINKQPKRALLTKREIWLIAGLLLFTVVLGLLLSRPSGGDMVRVYLDDALYAQASLSEDQTIVVEQAGGKRNELVIRDGEAYMRSATCANQDCVHQSPLSAEGAEFRALGSWIVCLPNRVSVELVRGEEE